MNDDAVAVLLEPGGFAAAHHPHVRVTTQGLGQPRFQVRLVEEIERRPAERAPAVGDLHQDGTVREQHLDRAVRQHLGREFLCDAA
jgi:hypothetical protein